MCVSGRDLPPLRPDAKLVLPSEQADASSCGLEGRRRMYWCHVPTVLGCYVPAVHSNCVHNERASLLLRTLGPTPEDPASRYLDEQFSVMRNLVRKHPVDRWSLERVAESYSGRLGLRYRRALDEIRVDGRVNRNDKKISAFLKAEKFNPLKKLSKPRMIMARAPKFNLSLASYLKPLEHMLWHKLKGPRYRTISTRQVGKGLNGRQRASLIQKKLQNIGDAVVFEVDGKSFESHVTAKDIAREHSIYRQAYKGDAHLNELLDVQLELKGKTVGGIRFRRPGARASGDFNTGLGNTLIMLAVVRASFAVLFDRLGRPFRWDTLCDGDNALIFVERDVATWVHKSFAAVVQSVSSQELAVENPVTALEEIVFGQSKPCWNGHEYIMVRDPLKVISTAFSGYRHYDHYNFGLRLIKAVSQCELALARGIPILEAYFAKALELVGNVPDLRDPEMYLEGRLLEASRLLRSSGETLADVKPLGVSARARRSFEVGWGISVERQLEMERELLAGLAFPHCGGGPWAEIKRWLRGSKVHWAPFVVTDGPHGQVPEPSIVAFLDSML